MELVIVATPLLPVRAAAAPSAVVSKLHAEGATRYRLGRFREALVKFKAALALTARPSLLFNIAQCHRQLGERGQALFYYKLYLSESERLHPNQQIPFAAEVKGHLRRLQSAAKTSTTKPAAAAVETSTTKPAAAAIVLPPGPGRNAIGSVPVNRPIYKRWWFWTLIGAAVIGATAAAVAANSGGFVQNPVGTLPPGQVQLK